MDRRLLGLGATLLLVAATGPAAGYHIQDNPGSPGGDGLEPHEWTLVAGVAAPNGALPCPILHYVVGVVAFVDPALEAELQAVLGSICGTASGLDGEVAGAIVCEANPGAALPGQSGVGGLCFMAPGFATDPFASCSFIGATDRGDSDGLFDPYDGGPCLAAAPPDPPQPAATMPGAAATPIGAQPLPTIALAARHWYRIEMLDDHGAPVPFIPQVGPFGCGTAAEALVYDDQFAYTVASGHVTGYPTVPTSPGTFGHYRVTAGSPSGWPPARPTRCTNEAPPGEPATGIAITQGLRRTAMRAFALLLVALLLVPPPTAGQTPATEYPSVHLLDDGTADVAVTVADQGTTAPSDRWAALDLKGLDVQEQTEGFQFTLAVASLSPDVPAAPFVEQGSYSLYFHHGDRDFRIQIQSRGINFAGNQQYIGRVQASDPGQNAFFGVGPDQVVEVDVAAGTFRLTVDRDLLADSNGAAPQPGATLSGFHARSSGLLGNVNRGVTVTGGTQAPTPRATDLMPNSGNGTLDFEVKFGVVQTGHARLHSDIPTRASNGEATTFVYQVQAYNSGPDEDRFNLVATGAPSAWQVKLPASQIPIPGNGSVVFPVLVTTPFAHVHGAFQNFVVEMRSQSDPGSVGRVQLGVRYLDPPQPAGHHNTLWLHSTLGPDDPETTVAAAVVGTGTFNSAYFNAGEVDLLDASVPVPPDFRFGPTVGADGTPRMTFCWDIPLSPILELGIDMDLDAPNGTYSLPFASQLPLLGASVHGEVVRVGPPDGGFTRFGDCGFANAANVTSIMTLGDSAPADFTGANQVLTGEVGARAEGDYMQYEKGATLLLVLTMTGTRVDPFLGGDMPKLLPGGILEALPLSEYHDPVNDVFVSQVELVSDSPQDRAVNPGRSVLFTARLLNNAGTDQAFNLELTGPNHEWARVLGPTRLEVPAGGQAKVNVAVTVPEGTAAGQVADLVLTATSETDLGLRSLLRLFATVEPGTGLPDDSAAIATLDTGEAASTPGLEPVVLLGALAAVAVVLRRRKQA